MDGYISDILAVKIVNMLSRAAHASAAVEESPTQAAYYSYLVSCNQPAFLRSKCCWNDTAVIGQNIAVRSCIRDRIAW